MRPEERVRNAAYLLEWKYTRSKRNVPMAHLQHRCGWASLCWFEKSQCFKVFVDGEGIGCSRSFAGLVDLTEEAERRLEERDAEGRSGLPAGRVHDDDTGDRDPAG